MSITYQVRPCINPNGETGVDYAANFAVKTGDYDFDQLVEDIQFSTTATSADIVAVLKAAQEYIKKGLLAGQRIVLEDIGAMELRLRSKCYKQSLIGTDDFNPGSYIKGCRVLFRPNASLLKHVRLYYKVKRIPSELMD